jgi:hypothetical protein
MASSGQLTIHYHRDFDGMVSAACLAVALAAVRGESPRWKSVNYDQRSDWSRFEEGRRFAIVDFHFHPRAEYWFDHHATTFLTPELRAEYRPSERWHWDEASPSCPPLVLRHAREHWGFEAPERFHEMARWSDIIDAARFVSVEQALFADDPALRIMRSLTAAPDFGYPDTLVEAMTRATLSEVAARPDVDKCFQRAARNRDKALEQFPPTVKSNEQGVLLYDASSNQIRRERFAPFFHHPEISYAVGVIPTRSGFHVTAGENPWRPAPPGIHLGQILERFGGGGHKSVGGANPHDLESARRVAEEVAGIVRGGLAAAGNGAGRAG